MANQFTLKNGGYEPFIGNYGLVPQPPIPAPESTDNGKVLGVSEGQYALVSGGGGGGGALFSMTDDDYDSETGIFTSSSFTAQDVLDAYFSGSPVLIYFPKTPYSGETILSLLSASKVMTEGSGIPHFDFTTNNTISYNSLAEDKQHMQFSVYID